MAEVKVGLDIVESARISLAARGELSERQMAWLKRNVRIHKIDVGEKKQAAEEINELFDELIARLEEVKEAVEQKLEL